MGKTMDEVLIVNKPKGWASHDVVNKVRRIYGIKKVGHAGTLDPMATGVLIILIGKVTKRQAEFMKMEKEYETEITFGAETDTYDAEGSFLPRHPEERSDEGSPQGRKGILLPISHRDQNDEKGVRWLTRKKVEKALKSFEGEIEQAVPPFSAVKVKGKKLYELAREGRIGEVDLPKRRVFIKEIELIEFQPFQGDSSSRRFVGTRNDGVSLDYLPKVKVRVVCSKGTYIRSLAHDLGKKLGCGAFLSKLIRTRVGKYKLGSKEVMELGRLKIKE